MTLTGAENSPPKPVVKKSRWPFPIIWIVPLLAAAVAGYYFYQLYRQRGREITITFADVSGLKTGESPVNLHGVRVGTVTEVDLSTDEKQAVVHVRFQRDTMGLARKGTSFWLVRPDLSGGNITGLGTLATGPYVEVMPGPGEQTSTFVGSDKAPIMAGAGIKVIVRASRVEHVQVDSPVFYRGIQVGVVQDIRLSGDSTVVNLTLFIWQHFTPLLRSNSVFWALSAADIKGGLFSGLQIELSSIRTLLGSGLSFATPEQGMGGQAVNGTEFTLQEQKKEWLTWTPKIPLGPDPDSNNAGSPVSSEQSGLSSAIRVSK